MNIIIRETGEREQLAIYTHSGINWVQDLIGNAGALSDGQFVWDDERSAYLCDQDTYDWWAQYICALEQTDIEVGELADELNLDPTIVMERVGAYQDNDYEQHRPAAVRAMQELRDERRAASAFGRMGGRATSPAKAATARANGKRGGRPRKQAQ